MAIGDPISGQYPDRDKPSLYPLKGGDSDGLMAKLDAARHRWAKSSGQLPQLVREQTAHVNRIKGLLFGQGIRGINVKSRCKALVPAELVTADGRPLPERLVREIAREIERLEQVQEQLRQVEREPDLAPTCSQATEQKRQQLLRLKGIGTAIAAILSREVDDRQFANRGQVASFIGLAPKPLRQR